MSDALSTIVKRDGRQVPFSVDNVIRAIEKAGKETKTFDKKEAKRLAVIVQGILEKVVGVRKEPISVEQIQDIVEQVLMAAGHFKTAKAYILYRAEHAKIRKAETIIGVENDLNLSLNQLKVIERRYLLHDVEGKPTESPAEMFRRVARTLAGVEKRAKRKKLEETFYEVMTKLEFLPGGRTLNNAGTPQNQLANCFVLPVEDSMEEIFDAVKWTALVHQKGGGCVAEGSKVFTSFCGLENFEVLYERLGGKSQEKQVEEYGWKINVENKKIKTLALDTQSGSFVKDDIQSIWRYELPKERVYSIHMQGGQQVTTSDWHPFFVYEDDVIKERRADEIQEGDYVFSGNPSILSHWLFPKYQLIDGYKIDENLGWLVGYILGDGSFGKAPKTYTKQKKQGIRLRLFDGNKETLEKAERIIFHLTQHHHKIQKDTRSKTLYLTVASQDFVLFLQRLTNIYGPKGSTLRIPSELIKSPTSVIAALLAGLLDSDGYVSKSRYRLDFATESNELAEQIVSLLALLGIHGAIRERKPRMKHWHFMYEVKIDGVMFIKRIYQLLSQYIVGAEKSRRLRIHAESEKNITGGFSPLLFSAIQPLLEKAGVPTSKLAIHRGAVKVGEKSFWLHRYKQGNGISIPHMLDLLLALINARGINEQDKKVIERWIMIHYSLNVVIQITRPKKGGNFYDFTTKMHHNYLAGKNGLSVVHNTGFNFTPLRPRGDSITKSSGGFATGPVSFMKVFDIATRQVMQGGKQRGANMGILAANHPDIQEFITCKNTEGEISNFNISVGATDDFMKAVEKDQEFALRNPRTQVVVQKIAARLLMDQIVSLAWRTGDPGMIYWDAINRNNPLMDSVGPIYATNPCGEQPLHPFDSCNLGSINLAAFVRNVSGKTMIDWDRLASVTKTATRMLDNVIDACKYPLPQITQTVKQNRRIGLGVMGWADLLLHLGIAYNSDEGVRLAEKVMKFVQEQSWIASEELATEKSPFPRWNKSWFAKGFDPITHRYDYKKKPRKFRNVAITTIAPTGTISMAADCSSGIEPVFALCYVKNVVDAAGLTYVNKYFEQVVRAEVGDNGQFNAVVAKVAETGSAQHVENLSDKTKSIFVTAHDIEWQWHVKMQAAFQKYTDNAVSKTINFPSTATLEEIRGAYVMAWKMGCKGITVYRDKSKNYQVLAMKTEIQEEKTVKKNATIMQSQIRHTPLTERRDFSALVKQEIQKGDVVDIPNTDEEKCPECDAVMQNQEGCNLCLNCGYSKCKL